MKKISTNKNDTMNEYFFCSFWQRGINQGPGDTYTKGGRFFISQLLYKIKLKLNIKMASLS